MQGGARVKISGGLIGLWLAASCHAAAAPAAPMRVPFQLEHGLPTIHASVGNAAVSLILDLGGGYGLALTPQVAARVPVAFNGRSHRVGDSAGHTHTAREYVAPRFSAGELKLGSVAGGELIRPAGFPWDGYLGLGLLKRYLLVFDYPHGELRLYPAGSLAAMRSECGSARIPLALEDGVVVSRVDTDRGRLRFAWDTGSNLDMLRPSAAGARADGKEGPPTTVLSRFTMGGVDFGPVRLPLVPFAAPAVDGFIGSPFLRSRIACVDVASGVAAIRTPPSAAAR